MDWTLMTGRDPFTNTADVDAYVPRTATESVLVNLEMALRDGARVVWLTGPAGAGKTLLLRVLEERVAGDFAVLRVPYSKLDADEFFRWALDALGEPRAADAERALAARLARGANAGDAPLIWVIDDSDLLPVSTLLALLQLQRGTAGALRLLLASSTAPAGDELAQAGVMPAIVELEGDMGRDEMAHYVRARLVRAGADPGQRAAIEAELDRLYERSRGNPGRLHAAASALLCFGPDRLRAELEERDAPAADPVVAQNESASVAVEADGSRAEIAVESPIAERTIESLVAEAVASEPPEEVAIADPPAAIIVVEPAAPDAPAIPVAPTTALVAPAAAPPADERRVTDPAPADEPTASDPPPAGPVRPGPRKRHRLRRLGRR
jgi:type II secretory pathway predicted ATPase ExeA